MEFLASGAYGQVYYEKSQPHEVVKIIRAKDASECESDHMSKEISKHEHIATVISVKIIDDKQIIRMKRYVNDVYHYTKDANKQLTIDQTLHMERQIGSALTFLHDSLGILHGDVKPQNILVDEDMNFYLCDFSISMNLKTELRTHGQIYSVPYRPPILNYNDQLENGNKLKPIYDFFALFFSLYYAHTFVLITIKDTGSLQCFWQFRMKKFNKLLDKEFKHLFYKDMYVTMMHECF
jgi:serine/threonine protein kinase